MNKNYFSNIFLSVLTIGMIFCIYKIITETKEAQAKNAPGLYITQRFDDPNHFGCQAIVSGNPVVFRVQIDEKGAQSVFWNFLTREENSPININFPDGTNFRFLRYSESMSMSLEDWAKFQKAVNENEKFSVNVTGWHGRYPRDINTAQFLRSAERLDFCIRLGTSMRLQIAGEKIDTGIILNKAQ